MIKKLPACKTCVSSGFLCTNCQENLDQGVISEFELDLSKDFLELEENDKYSFLKEVSFNKAIDFEDVIILVLGNRDKIKISPDLIAWIKKRYKVDEIILVEKTTKPRSVVDSLIAPTKLISLNEIFLATGDMQFRAVIPKEDKDKILFTREELEELILELTGNITRIEFQ